MNIDLTSAKTKSCGFYLNGVPFVFSAWIYCRGGKIIDIFDQHTIETSGIVDYRDVNNDFFCQYYDSGIGELFDQDDTGLFFVSGRVRSEWSTDYYGEADHCFIINDVYAKEKCVSFSHLKWVYKNIIKPEIDK